MASLVMLLLAATLLCFSLGTGATSTMEYWSKTLPNTPMPDLIKALLSHNSVEDDKANVEVTKGGVHVNTGKGTTVDVGKGTGVNVNVPGKDGPKVNVGKPGGDHGGVNVHVGPDHKKPVGVHVNPGYTSPFNYIYAATEDQLKYDPNVALFFREETLRPGSKITLAFTKTPKLGTNKFLSQEEVETIPFSSSRMNDVYKRFDIEPSSSEAAVMKKTLQECEASPNEGETRYCATSLESMVDFSTARLDTKDVRVLATAVKDDKESKKQAYTILVGVQKMKSPSSVVCHEQPYVYPVFYCHKTMKTKTYMVPMEGQDGTRVNAVAVCHTDTSKWNPNHVAFKVLGVKPGSVPVCHFLPEDHVVWVAN